MDCLNWFAARPETGQTVSAENDVLEGNIYTKKDVQGDKPEQIVKQKLCVLFQMEPEYLKDNYESIVH